RYYRPAPKPLLRLTMAARALTAAPAWRRFGFDLSASWCCQPSIELGGRPDRPATGASSSCLIGEVDCGRGDIYQIVIGRDVLDDLTVSSPLAIHKGVEKSFSE